MIEAKKKPDPSQRPAPPASDPLRSNEPSPQDLRDYDRNQRYYENERR